MNNALVNKLEKITNRFNIIEEELSNLDITKDINKLQSLYKERADLKELVEKAVFHKTWHCEDKSIKMATFILFKSKTY